MEPSSIAIPDHLHVFQKHYLTICTTIEYPEILSQQLLHENLVTEDEISQVREDILSLAYCFEFSLYSTCTYIHICCNCN